MHISGTPHAALQIDWPLWLCDREVIEWLVRNVELVLALWSFPAEGNLEINGLCNGRCQQDYKKAESDWARQPVAENCATMWFVTVRFFACSACTLFWFIGSKQPFQRWDCKHQ